MRRDQEREESGRFGHREDSSPWEEKLENLVACKVTASEAREMAIMFDQHRRMFNWQTQSDLMREALRSGLRTLTKTIAKPDPELAQLISEGEQVEAATKAARRHAHHERTSNMIADAIRDLEIVRDFGQIRKILKAYLEVTKNTKDPVFRRRRIEEIEKRGWDRQLKDLDKGVSLTDFDDDNED
jgi:hypothetical protein